MESSAVTGVIVVCLILIGLRNPHLSARLLHTISKDTGLHLERLNTFIRELDDSSVEEKSAE